MATISTTQISNGTNADATAVDNNFDTIVNEINGNLDDQNLSDNAVTTQKITDGDVTAVKIASETWTSHTAVLTGFSGTPTQSNFYYKFGKTVIVALDINGTSNTTGFTLSLPFAPERSQNFSGFVIADNGANTANPGLLVLTAASTTATVAKDNTGAVFTAANAKKVQGTVVYETDL